MMGGLEAQFTLIFGRRSIISKIQIFCWHRKNNKILTKDNLLKRGWTGDSTCVFCGGEETVNHLLLTWDYSREILKSALTLFNVHNLPETFFDLWADWRISMLTGVKRLAWDMLGMIICWKIWTERNNRIFCSKHISTAGLTIAISNLMQESITCIASPSQKARLLQFFNHELQNVGAGQDVAGAGR